MKKSALKRKPFASKAKAPMLRRTKLKVQTALKKTALPSRTSPKGLALTTIHQPTQDKGLRRTPLAKDPRNLVAQAKVYHDEVFAAFGGQCYWFAACADIRPADDAAHILTKNELGKYRYRSVWFARPAHRCCHERQHAAVSGYVWAQIDIDAAKAAHDAIPGIRVKFSLKRNL